MNRQRKVLITITYNEMGIIIDTKAEELDSSAQSELEQNLHNACTDLISRADALNCFHDWIDSHGDVHTADEMPEYQRIEQLPTAQPERTGNWVEIGDEPYDEWECDRCGFVIDGSGCIDPEEYRDIYIFCPHCGSLMLKEGEEHD